MTSLAKATTSTLSFIAWNAKMLEQCVIYQNKLVGLEIFFNAKPHCLLRLFSYTRPINLNFESENCKKSIDFVNDLDLSRWPWPLMKLAQCQFDSIGPITYDNTFKPNKYLILERRNRLFSKSMIFTPVAMVTGRNCRQKKFRNCHHHFFCSGSDALSN